MEMKNEFFYEFNCIEDGEWVPEKQTFVTHTITPNKTTLSFLDRL